jgi:hypothetical protein
MQFSAPIVFLHRNDANAGIPWAYDNRRPIRWIAMPLPVEAVFFIIDVSVRVPAYARRPIFPVHNTVDPIFLRCDGSSYAVALNKGRAFARIPVLLLVSEVFLSNNNSWV